MKPGTRVYIVSQPAELAGYVSRVDRDYFAQPVPVDVVGQDANTGLLTVTDPRRGHTYPCCRTSLRYKRQLTNKQREQAEAREHTP